MQVWVSKVTEGVVIVVSNSDSDSDGKSGVWCVVSER